MNELFEIGTNIEGVGYLSLGSTEASTGTAVTRISETLSQRASELEFEDASDRYKRVTVCTDLPIEVKDRKQWYSGRQISVETSFES